MDNRTDQELLQEYVARGADSEAAFSEVVRRHVDFVYSAALRLVRSPPLAEDVSQKVFLALAQNARQLADRAMLAGWLHYTARNLSANLIRSDVRRRAREQEAAAMNDLVPIAADTEPEPAWDSIAPHLDDAMGQLGEADRDAIFLRYFQRKSAQEMAAALGVSTQAAQKRVNRAVERLRGLFAQRGISAGTVGALAVLLGAKAVQAPPAGLSFTISAAANASALVAGSIHASASTATISTTKIILMTTLQKALIVSAVVAIVAGTGIYQTQKRARARQQRQLQAARQQSQPKPPSLQVSSTMAALAANRASQAQRPPAAARKPATPAARTPQSTTPGGFQSTEMYALMVSKNARLTAAQAAPYLAANGRNASSLLAAFRTTGDPALLTEALQKHSDDPQVGFEAAIRIDASAQQRRAALDAFKQAAPENALACYLSALDHFKAGQVDDAVDDLNAAATRTQFQDYILDRIRTDEDMYRLAGHPPGEAQFMASAFLPEAHLTQLIDLGHNLVDLAAGYASIGDQDSQKAALQMALNLGQHLDDPAAAQTMRWQLIGLRIERAALEVMDPSSPISGSDQLVQARLDQLGRQKDSLQQLTKQADPLWKSLSDADWTGYHAQLAAGGEESAVRWLVNNFPRR